MVCRCSSIIAVIAAFFQEREKLKDKQEALENERKRTLVYEEIIQNQKVTLDSARSIIQLQGKLDEANLKLIEANTSLLKFQEETLNRVTGGDSRPTLLIEATRMLGGPFHNYAKKPFYLLNFLVGNSSEKYPLKNVVLNIDDFVGKTLSMHIRVKGTKSNVIISYTNKEDQTVLSGGHNHTFNLGTINSNDEAEVYSTAWIETVEGHSLGGMEIFNISINAENGFHKFKFKLKETDGKCILKDVTVFQNGTAVDSEGLIKLKNNPSVDTTKL